MATFRFELDPVLRQRRAAEERRQREVAVLERERLRLEGVIRGHQRGIDEERAAWRAGASVAPGAAIDVGMLRRQASASLGRTAAAQRAAIELAGVLKRLESARALLLKAAGERRAMELLRESRFEAWRRAQARAEAAAMDDLVVMRHGRTGGAG